MWVEGSTGGRTRITSYASTLCALFCTATLFTACGDTGAAAETDAPDAAAEVEPADVDDAAPDARNDTISAAETADTVAQDIQGELPVDPTACTCGDGECAKDCGETLASCPVDCNFCGDNVCSPGESPKSCAVDCCGGCGDGICKGYDCGESPQVCPTDCGKACGNKICDKGESPATCAMDCIWQVCGNGVCEPDDGGPQGCPNDCAPTCGDCVCEGGESWVDCPGDCGFCGDNVCSVCATLGETTGTCPVDCKVDGCGGTCDDGVPCTVDVCGSAGACIHVVSNAACSDGNACTVDVCLGDKGCIAYSVSGPPCEDGDPCTSGDYCLSGACQFGAPKVCNDGNGCTDDACSSGVCLFVANTTTCDDGDLCTLSDACSATVCAGLEVDCSDGVPCTFDFCGASGCGHIADPTGCDDAEPCTTDSCSLAEGCTHTAHSGACSDGDSCTYGDSCAGGVCQKGTPMNCVDGNGCTADSCVDGVCLFADTTSTCEDGNPCTVNDTCAVGTCVGTIKTCDDGIACTTDACNPSDGGCTHAPDAKACEDGNGCTADACTASEGCTYAFLDGLTCSDGSACTIGDQCAGGQCSNYALNCDDKNDCTVDGCDATVGCTHTNETEGSACGTGGACLAGVCTCPDNSLAVVVDAGGLPALVCAYDYPAWGRRSVNPIFTDNANDTVSDPQTGLMWQVGLEVNAKWGYASTQCDQLTLGGHIDWRLPTETELETLIVLDRDAAAGGFTPTWPTWGSTHYPADMVPTPTGTYLWSMTHVAGMAQTWAVYNGDGVQAMTLPADSSQIAAFRCVRTEAVIAPVPTRFVGLQIGGASVVQDLATHLLWQANAADKQDVDAANYCASLKDAGARWALPNALDALSLLDRRMFAPSVVAPFVDGGAKMLTTSFVTATTMLMVYGYGGGLGATDPWTAARCVGTCDDGDPCTTDAPFDPVNGCVHTPVNDGLACGDIGICNAGVCTCPSGTWREVLETDNGSKVVCAYDYPAWGIRPLTPASFVVHTVFYGEGQSTESVSDTETGLMWQFTSTSDKLPYVWAVMYCDRARSDGYDDWRMPTMAELLTLRDWNAAWLNAQPAIDQNYFSLGSAFMLWANAGSSAVYAPYLSAYGDVGKGGQKTPMDVLCVRTETQIQPPPKRLVLSAIDDVVHDYATNRLWQHYLGYPPAPPSMPPYVSLPEAQSACAALTAGGATWRLSSIVELASLQTPWSSPSLDPLVYPTVNGNGLFWSLTESVIDAATSYFAMLFYTGYVNPGVFPPGSCNFACVGDCDDGNACTTDSFDDLSGCVHLPVGPTCTGK